MTRPLILADCAKVADATSSVRNNDSTFRIRMGWSSYKKAYRIDELIRPLTAVPIGFAIVLIILVAIPPALVHFAAEFVVLSALCVIEYSPDFVARFFLDCFESRLRFFAKFLKLVTSLFADLAHLFALRLVQS